MRHTTVSATDAYRANAGLSGGETLMKLLRARLAPVDAEQRSRPEPTEEDIFDMSIYDDETTADDDPGVWIREGEERRATIADPWAGLEPTASDDPEFDEMVAHRVRFERAALAAERAKRPDFGRSVGDLPSLTRAEHARLWEATKHDDLVGDISWLER